MLPLEISDESLSNFYEACSTPAPLLNIKLT